jgi:AcrR family transcriptional regulator
MTPNEPDIKLKILLAAKKLFARNGFDGTSVRQICEEAGANVALVSYHFGGKENVFIALFDTFLPSHKLHELDAELQRPLEGLCRIIREVTQLRVQDPELMTILQQEVALQSPRIDVIRKRVFPVWEKLREVLRSGQEEQLFRFRSLDHTMLFVLGTLFIHKQYNYFEQIMEEGTMPYELVLMDTIEFVLRGLGVSEDQLREVLKS